MSDNNLHTACIIGGGMSGLFTGALLARNGYKVTVLEKNHIIGGGLQSFRRGDAVFNTGMQSFAGYMPNMISLQFCKYCRVDDLLDVMPTDENQQEIVWVDNQTNYRLPKGREAYQSYLIKMFPQEEKGIGDLMDAVFYIGHTYDYLFLNPIRRHEENIPYAYMNAYDFILQYVHNEQLISVFEYVSWTSGPSLKAMPALEFCMMLTLYIIGSHRFVGGTKQMVDAFCHVIEKTGGKVYNETEVCKINVENGRVVELIDTNGKKWGSDVYVWACTPKILLDACNAPVFRLAMTQRVREFVNPFTMYIVFCKLKPKRFPFINSAVYMPRPSDKSYLPQSIVLVTSPHRNQNQWAQTAEIYIPACYEELGKWENTKVQDRGRSYEEHKNQVARKTLDMVSNFYPDITDAVMDINVASALTIRDYYGNPHGATYGQQGLYLPIKTKVANLFMTGQAVQNQGIAGIATAATLTAETILGKSIIDEIAKA